MVQLVISNERCPRPVSCVCKFESELDRQVDFPRNSTDRSSCAFVRQFSDTWQAISSSKNFPVLPTCLSPQRFPTPLMVSCAPSYVQLCRLACPGTSVRNQLPHPRVSHKGRASFHDDLRTTRQSVSHTISDTSHQLCFSCFLKSIEPCDLKSTECTLQYGNFGTVVLH